MYEEYLNKIHSIRANEVSLEMEEVIKNQTFILPNSSTQKVLKQKLSDISKLIELLCDPIRGSCAPNIPVNSRYNQKIKCKDFLFVNSSKNVQKKGSRDNVEKNTVIEVNPPSTSLMKSNVAFDSKEKESSIDDIEMDTVINDNPLLSCIPQNDVTSDPDHEASNQKGRKGRPLKYLTEEEKRASLAKNSKKYLEKKKEYFCELQKEVASLEKEHKVQINFLRKLETTNSNCDVIDAENAMKDSSESSNSNEDSDQRQNFDKLYKKTTVQKSRKRKSLEEVEKTNKKLPHKKEKTLGEVSDLRKQPASIKEGSQAGKDFEALSSSPEKDAAVSKSYKDGQKETSSMEPHLQQAQCENLKKLQSESEKQILNDRIIPSESSYPNKNKFQNLSRYFIEQKAARRMAVKKFRQKRKMEMKEMEEKKKSLCQEIKNNLEKMQKFREQGGSMEEVDRTHVDSLEKLKSNIL
uniref:BZIP domain-containing protein n=2 Tax=Panagrolaimus sp. ES5 TaxID=591445 RepID=A0AC34F020_9BILA